MDAFSFRDVARTVKIISAFGLGTDKILEPFKTYNVVQLISRSSGKALQVLPGTDGEMALDALGEVDPENEISHWNCIREEDTVKLHINNNYLAIKNGTTILVNYRKQKNAGPETKLRLDVVERSYVTLESDTDEGHHVGAMPDGKLKPALVCGKEIEGQWGVRLIFAPEDAASTSLASDGTSGLKMKRSKKVKPMPAATNL